MAKNNNVPADLYEVEWGKALDIEQIDKALNSNKYDVICITHNETSTGNESCRGNIRSCKEISRGCMVFGYSQFYGRY